MSRSSLAVTILLTMTLGLTGCQRYEALSPHGYRYAQALYSIANRRAAQGLERVEEGIAQDVAAGHVSAREQDHLQSVIALCRGEQWEVALRRSRAILESQAQLR